MGKEKNEDKPCRLYPAEGKRFCHRNHGYMENYTDEMLQNLKRCSGCGLDRYIGHFEKNANTCNIVCRPRGEKNRKKKRNELDPKRQCKHVGGCVHYVKDEGEIFCKKHRRLGKLRMKAEAEGKKLCSDRGHWGCENFLDKDSPKTYCDVCLEKDRERDNKNYAERQKKIDKETTTTHRGCLGCPNRHELSKFHIGTGKKLGYYCQDCRAKKK